MKLKKICSGFFPLFLVVVSIITTSNVIAQKPVLINGTFTRDKFSQVKLFKVVDGTPFEIATSLPNKKGEFGFQFYPEYEGLYLVGMGQAISPVYNYKFWLKPGDRLSLKFTDSSYQLTGALNTKENQVLTQWYNMAWLLEKKGVYFFKSISTYVDFFPELQNVLTKSDKWLALQKGTGNKKFDGYLKKIVKMDIALYANMLLTTPRTTHPDMSELPAYYEKNSLKKLIHNSDDVYFYPWGNRLLYIMTLSEAMIANDKPGPGLKGLMLTLNKYAPDNDTLKGDLAIQFGDKIKDYSSYMEFKDSVGKYIVTEEQQKQDFAIASKLASFKPGDPGYVFNYEDKNSNMVSLNDLKGKVVLVDMWATWCGPCKQQIPYLKKLEEEMKGKDIAIVSISVDEEVNKDKWKKMIADQELGGIQLFAKGWSEMTKYYRITGIPRFLVFDKEGKIVSIDAPRPSSPELKSLLEKQLKKAVTKS